MIARVGRIQVHVDKLDGFKNSFEKSVVSVVKQQKGYRSSCLLMDRKTGNCISIGFWDTEQEALADKHTGHLEERVDSLKEFVVVPHVIELYEMAVRD